MSKKKGEVAIDIKDEDAPEQAGWQAPDESELDQAESHEQEIRRRFSSEEREAMPIMVFSAPSWFVKENLISYLTEKSDFAYEQSSEYFSSALQNFLISSADEDLEQIYDHVFETVKQAKNSGKIQNLEPQQRDDGRISYAHENGSELQQIENPPGKFSFSPGPTFTGVLTVERMGPDGKLMPGAVDIIEYHNGKPTVVISSQEGTSRVRDIDLIQQQVAQGISVMSTSSKVTAPSQEQRVEPPVVAPVSNTAAKKEEDRKQEEPKPSTREVPVQPKSAPPSYKRAVKSSLAGEDDVQVLTRAPHYKSSEVRKR